MPRHAAAREANVREGPVRGRRCRTAGADCTAVSRPAPPPKLVLNVSGSSTQSTEGTSGSGKGDGSASSQRKLLGGRGGAESNALGGASTSASCVTPVAEPRVPLGPPSRSANIGSTFAAPAFQPRCHDSQQVGSDPAPRRAKRIIGVPLYTERAVSAYPSLFAIRSDGTFSGAIMHSGRVGPHRIHVVEVLGSVDAQD